MEQSYKDKLYRKKLPQWLYVIIGIFVALVLIVTFVYIAFNVVYDYYPVNGASMWPTLNEHNVDEDGVFVNIFDKGEIGDIIVIQNPTNKASHPNNVIKRLIATGGDKVAVKYDKNTNYGYISVIRKGSDQPVMLIEDYLDSSVRGRGMEQCFIRFYNQNLSSKTFDSENPDYLIIPEGYIFYLGDNREVSLDCSEYGPISKSQILGKAEIIIKGRKNSFSQIMNFFTQQVVEFFS